MIGIAKNAITGQIDLMELCQRAGFIIICSAMAIDGFFLKKIRIGQANKLSKAIMILLIIGVVLTLINVVYMLITKASMELIDLFPLLLALLVMYSNSFPKK